MIKTYLEKFPNGKYAQVARDKHAEFSLVNSLFGVWIGRFDPGVKEYGSDDITWTFNSDGTSIKESIHQVETLGTIFKSSQTLKFPCKYASQYKVATNRIFFSEGKSSCDQGKENKEPSAS